MSTSRPRRSATGHPAVALLAAFTFAGCDARQDPAPDRSTTVREPTSATPTISASTATAPAGSPVLTAEGYGPLRIGMSLAEVTVALGPDAAPEAVGGAGSAQCDQFRPVRAPEGMLVMMEQGRLTRISLTRQNSTKTARGVGLGSTADAVIAAYGDAARVSPHKYVDPPASYITVWTKDAPAPDAGSTSGDARGIVFEVEARGLVGMIHAGGPSIQHVEGCA